MKNLFIATLAAAAMFASCNDNTDITPIDPASGPQVQINFGTSGQTRAFFEDSSTGEAWENAINAFEIHVFDQSGKYILKHSVSESEIAAKSVRITLPPTAAATSCTFFAIANCANLIYSIHTADVYKMETAGQNNWFSRYNGTFEDVSTGSKYQEGFLMTDKVTATVAPLGSATTVPLTLRRDVAKIALRIGLDDDFKNSIAGGALIINSVVISKMNLYSYIFQNTTPLRGLAQPVTQVPARNGEYFDALFYIYANDAREAGNRVLLTLTGYYDADGDDSTTEDRQTVVYNLELDGTNSDGSIERNVYYRVNAVIEGLAGDRVTSNLVVANWSNLVNQTTKIGS